MNPLPGLPWVAAGGFAIAVGMLVFRLFPSIRPHRRETPPPSADSPAPGTLRGLWRRWQEREGARNRLVAAGVVLPQALEVAIQALKAGQTIPQAIEILAQESASPLREEFALVSREMAWGASAEEALESLARRVPNAEVIRFVESYRLSRRTGANLTQLLATLREGLEERERILRRLDSMTAQARLSGLLMGCLPFFLLAVLALMDPVLMRPLFTTGTGWGILAIALLLEIAGFLWIRSLLRLEPHS